MQTLADSVNPLVERLKEIRAGVTPERQAEIDAELAIQRDLAKRKAIVSVGMPTIFERVPFEVAPKRAQDWARKCWKGDSRNLVLIGDSGEGKTEAACALLGAMAPHVRCRFATFGDILREVRATYGADGTEAGVMGKWEGCAVLCLDDLGKGRPTQDVLDKLFALVAHRYNHGRPTIFTTQYKTPSDLGNRLMSQGGDAETAEAIVRRVFGMGDHKAEVVSCH
ncbi:ATP-binding protein [uncultured Slackia sp.]|uniref:ATP-binding protein n=1 Tax=uncultured Slackia sp. TaxID=665903 RepID=UPI0025D0EE11|nr:ATP-binding protein [uncultured Slackia sp.]